MTSSKWPSGPVIWGSALTLALGHTVDLEVRNFLANMSPVAILLQTFGAIISSLFIGAGIGALIVWVHNKFVS
jgi:hypothetical protein